MVETNPGKTTVTGPAATLKPRLHLLQTGVPGLDAVLSEIELRVEVELAKAGRV